MIESKQTSNTRAAAVAGMFYPDNPQALSSTVAQMLESANTSLSAVKVPAPKALIVPHAGYVYSGQVAADAYALLRNRDQPITRVVLLGPAHRVGFNGIAASSANYFETPLGKISLDQAWIKTACEIDGIKKFDLAHAEEHSLEVQLPFLQLVLNDFLLAPFVVGSVNDELTEDLIDCLWGGDETLIVISSDLSHFLDYETAQMRDAATAQKIEALNGKQISSHDACGYKPIRGLLRVAKKKQLDIQQIARCNSGDTAGEKQRVVGYGAYALH